MHPASLDLMQEEIRETMAQTEVDPIAEPLMPPLLWGGAYQCCRGPARPDVTSSKRQRLDSLQPARQRRSSGAHDSKGTRRGDLV
jgi:hypothetical protein